MRFCSFDHAGHGAFSLHAPSIRFPFVSSAPHRRVCFSRRGPLRLRPSIASDKRARFIISAGESPSPISADSRSDEDLKGRARPERQQASAASSSPDASSREGNASSNGSPSSSSASPSGDSSSSSGSPARVEFTSASSNGNQASSSSSSPLSSSSSSPSGSPASVEFTSASSNGNQASSSLSSSSSSSPPPPSSSSSSSLSSPSSWTPAATQAQNSGCKITGSAFHSARSFLPEFKSLSPMSRGIKTAFDVLQGWKVLQKLQDSEAIYLTAGGWIFLSIKGAKYFAKGLKMSQKVLASSSLHKLILERHPNRAALVKLVHNDLASAARGFNAFYAAIKIAQFSISIGKQSQEEGSLPDMGFLWKGFSFSKSLVSFLDAVVGKNGWAVACMGKGFFITKTAIGGISVMAKAAFLSNFLSKELGPAILKRLAVCSGTLAAILRARRQTGDSKSRTLAMFQQGKSKGFSSLTLFKDCYIRGALTMLATEEQFCKDEGLFSLCSLMCSIADNSFVKHSKEDDLMSVFCLAIPLQANQGPVFA